MMVKFQDLPWTEWEDVFLLLDKLFPVPQKVALGIFDGEFLGEEKSNKGSAFFPSL